MKNVKKLRNRIKHLKTQIEPMPDRVRKWLDVAETPDQYKAVEAIVRGLEITLEALDWGKEDE